MACKCSGCKCGKQPTENLNPFTEEAYSKDTVLRHFDPTASADLFRWETNHELHWVESINENNWMFQFDDESPISIEPGKIIQIPIGASYRLIKGTSPLTLYLKH